MLCSACAFTWKHSSFRVTDRACLLTRWFIRSWFKIDSKLTSAFGLVQTDLSAFCANTIPISPNAPASRVFFIGGFFHVTVLYAAFSNRQCEQCSRAAGKQGQSRCWLALCANRSIFRHEDKWMLICAICHVSLFVMRNGGAGVVVGFTVAYVGVIKEQHSRFMFFTKEGC